jgi:hypothetical protein
MDAGSRASEFIGGKATVPVEGNWDQQDPRRYKETQTSIESGPLTSEADSVRIR